MALVIPRDSFRRLMATKPTISDSIVRALMLPGGIVLDEKGFVLTERSLPAHALEHPIFAEMEPLPFETSVPGVRVRCEQSTSTSL
jgi:hypothetical protein